MSSAVPTGALPIATPCAASARGLTIERRDGRSRRMVLEDVSLTAQPGAVTAILGGEGAGKTSLLAGIAGLLKLQRGNVLTGGVDVTRQRASRRRIGFLPPGTRLGGDRSLLATLASLHPRIAEARLLTVLLHLDLPQSLPVNQLGQGGALAALSAARLLPAGDVLLVDEAASGLSRPRQEAVMDWLRQEAVGGRTVLIATREEAIGLQADHLVLLKQGRLVQAGAPAELHLDPCSEDAAMMTGPAAILRGTVRQKLPGSWVWVAAGRRFTRADTPGQQAPALGAEIALCLRPSQLSLDAGGAPNQVEGVVERLVVQPAGWAVQCATGLGSLLVAGGVASTLRPGDAVRIGWQAGAGALLGA